MSTKLGEWLTTKRMTNKAFAGKIGDYLKRDTFSSRTVETWRAGKALPRKDALEAIAFVTDGDVTANDFVVGQRP